MICTFTKDITADMIENAVDECLTENDIQDVRGGVALCYIIAHAFELDNISDGEEIIKAMDEHQKTSLLIAFEDEAMKYLRDDLHRQLWG